ATSRPVCSPVRPACEWWFAATFVSRFLRRRRCRRGDRSILSLPFHGRSPVFMSGGGTHAPVLLEPVLAGLHDQRCRACLVHALVDGQLVGGQVRQVVSRDHAIGGQGVGQRLVHALHRQQFRRWLVRGQLLLGRERLV